MDITQIIVTLSGGALMGLTLCFFFMKLLETPSKSPGKIYACPMHPWITSREPAANCSICGMKLVRN